MIISVGIHFENNEYKMYIEDIIGSFDIVHLEDLENSVDIILEESFEELPNEVYMKLTLKQEQDTDMGSMTVDTYFTEVERESYEYI